MRILQYLLITSFLSFGLFISSCSVNYSFTGADIPAEAKTVSVDYFSLDGRGAALAPPSTSDFYTNTLISLMITQTNLDVVNKDGDLQFEGNIVGYANTPVAAQSDETSNRNRLTITVEVTYINLIEPDKSFEKRKFSQFADFDANESLADIEEVLWEEIFEAINQDIFNTSLGSW
jgi:hypothetical protein